MRTTSKILLRQYGLIVLASILYCVSFNWLYVPNNIGYGGLTGLAQIVNALVPSLPIGIVTLVMNLPLFFFGWKYLGGHLLLSSLFAMVLTSVGLDILNAIHVFQPLGDQLLASIFGGATIGLALGIIFAQGATTGGTDIAARLVKLKLAWLPLGKVLLVLDLIVVAAVGLAFGDIKTALYGTIAMFIASYFTDVVLYGLDTSKVAYIISDKYESIATEITIGMGRGVTILHGEGAWSGNEKEVLMCAFRQKEIVALKHVVKELDPDAFLIVCPAHEVLGDGFRSHYQEEI